MGAQNEEARDFIDGVAAGGVVSGGVGRPGVGTAGAAGDQYAGLARLGRVVDQNWTDGTSSVDQSLFSC